MALRKADRPRLYSSGANAVWQAGEPVSAAGGQLPDLIWTGQYGQTIEGFGGCFNELGWQALQSAGEERDAVLTALFDPAADGLRFGFNRVPIGATDYAEDWYSCNEHDGDYAMERFSIERDRRELLPYVRAALVKHPGMRLFASPWSPPTWMKRPKAYNTGSLHWTDDNLNAYALYLLKFMQAYENEGVRIDQLHYQNEPCTIHRFPSCEWTGAQLRDFVRDYLGPLFRRESPATELWLGTLNSERYEDYAAVVLNDAEARSYLSGVGYQWAGKSAIQRTRAAWPELRLMQTENECGDGDNTWDYAHYVFGLIWHYLHNGCESYMYWNMVLPSGGRCTWGGRQNSLICVDSDSGKTTYNPEYYVFKHLSRFVGRGARRLELAGGWSAHAIAFETADGALAFVANNPFDEARTVIVGAGCDAYAIAMPPKSFHTLVV